MIYSNNSLSVFFSRSITPTDFLSNTDEQSQSTDIMKWHTFHYHFLVFIHYVKLTTMKDCRIIERKIKKNLLLMSLVGFDSATSRMYNKYLSYRIHWHCRLRSEVSVNYLENAIRSTTTLSVLCCHRFIFIQSTLSLSVIFWFSVSIKSTCVQCSSA